MTDSNSATMGAGIDVMIPYAWMQDSPTRRFGDYGEVATLTSGGMGEVLLARKVGAMGFERLAAVKTIRDDRRDEEQVRRMFRDEARIAARLHHPAIAQVYDFGSVGDILYLVMEYVAGVSLDGLAGVASEPLTPGHVARIGAAAARGLHAAHELVANDGASLGVVHRDVSPQNVMVTFDGAVKVIDFGIARARDGGTTTVGGIKGKPAYMAPEQLSAHGQVDRRTDIWALGVVLWELVAGRRLFAGVDSRSTVLAVLNDRIPELVSVKASTPESLSRIVARCLSRDATLRPASALEVAEELDAIAATSEGLETFATRALATARREHDVWLRGLLTGEVTSEPKGRAVGVATMGTSAPLASATVAVTQVEAARVDRRLAVFGAGVVVALGVATGMYFRSERVQVEEHKPIAQGSAIDDQLPTADDRWPDDRLPIAENRVPPTPPAPSPEPVVVQTKPRTKTKRPVTTPDVVPTATPVEHGFIRAIADPYALVRINGTVVGPTPITHHRVEAGSVIVELLEPDSGAVRVKRVVSVAANQTITVGGTP